MGLGPPVCRDCIVFLQLDDSGWYCPVCGVDSENSLHLWSSGISDETLKDNLKIWKLLDPSINDRR